MNQELDKKADALRKKLEYLTEKISKLNSIIKGINNEMFKSGLVLHTRPECSYSFFNISLSDYYVSISQSTQDTCLTLILADAQRQLEQAENELEALLPKESEVE